MLGRLEAVAAVAGEALVAAVTRERHRHVPACGGTNSRGRKGGAIAERLVVGRNQIIKRKQVRGIDLVDNVSCMKLLGHVTGIGRLVKAPNAELD